MLADRTGNRFRLARLCAPTVGLGTACAIAIAIVSGAVRAEEATSRDRVIASQAGGIHTPMEFPDGTLIGVTAPIRKATLAAVMPARILRIPVEEGAPVSAGEVVVELDPDVQRTRVAIAEAGAKSMLPVDLAKSEWDRAQRELDRFERLRDDSSASGKELSDARSLAQIRRLEYELAVFNHEQAVRAFERETALLDQHSIRAPFPGHVIEHLKHDGETVDQLEGIVTLVQLDPLVVTIDCPLELSGTIATGSRATTTPIGIARTPRVGRVTFVSPVADTGSQTFRVKLEVGNADGVWIAGMKVAVTLPPAESTRAVLTSHPGDERADEARSHTPPGAHR